MKNVMLRLVLISIAVVFVGLPLATSPMMQPETIIVPAGGNLQAALNRARFGDTIVLQAGVTYRAPSEAFVLPLKTGGTNTAADYITITTSNHANLPVGRRVLPADTPNMAKIVATGGRGALQVGAKARHWKLVGLEITNVSSGTGPEHVQDLLGSVDSGYSRNSKSAHFIIDRCYIHPQEDGLPTSDPNYKFRTASHGVAWNVADLTITNSRLSGFFGTYRHGRNIAIDSEAIAYSTGPGPLTLHNNYIDAWYAGLLTGGADTDSDNFGTIAGAQSNSVFTISISGGSAPAAGDMLAVANPGKEYSACKVGSVSGNTVTCQSPLVWNAQQNTGGPDAMAPAPVPVVGQNVKWRGYVMKGITITRSTFNIDYTFAEYWRRESGNNPKGFIEFKNGIDILMDGCIFQGYPSSIGFGLQNQSGSSPWSAIQNVKLKNLLFTRYSYAIGPMSVTGYSRLTERGNKIEIDNILAYGNGGDSDINGNASAFFTIGVMDGPLTVNHATVVDTSGGFTVQVQPRIKQGIFRNSIFYGKDYGHQCIPSNGHAMQCYDSLISEKNIIVNTKNLSPADIRSYWWPNSTVVANTDAVKFTSVAKNDYRLLSTSPGYRAGTDGKDIGVDMDALNAALGGAVPTPTPIPPTRPRTVTPSPNPTP